VDLLQREASALTTETRLEAAVSKVGRLDPENPQRLAEVEALVVDDLTSELDASHGAVVRPLTPLERDTLAVFLRGEARALVEQHLRRWPRV
jgi:hypothetical protein